MSTLAKSIAGVRAIARASGTRTALSYLYGAAVTMPEVVRSKTLVSADRRMSGRRWPYRVQGIAFELDGRFFSGAREMYCRRVYFPSPTFDLKPGTTIVDLGANVGLFSLLGALAGCRAIAVEAQHGFVRELTDLTASYGVAGSVVVEHALIGAGSGLFSDAAQLAAASHFEGRPPPCLSMEGLLARHRVDEVDFLKIDIEGSEFDLFRSDDRWLSRVRRIAMEVHTSFGSATELKGILESRGMSVELRDADLRVVEEVPDPGGYLFALR